MKVLWFTNTACNAGEYLKLKNYRGGWLDSLDLQIQKTNNIDLNIAFYHYNFLEPFNYLNSHYYPILSNKKKRNKFRRYINRFKSDTIWHEDIDLYLQIINNVQPDIIHVHGTENPFGLLYNYIDIPIVISIQGIVTVYNHKYFSGIPKKHILKGNTLRKHIKGDSFLFKYKKFESLVPREKQILLFSKFIIGRTNWDRRVGMVLSPRAKYFHCDEILRGAFYESIWNNNSIDNKFIIHSTIGNFFYKGLETIYETATILRNLRFSFEWNIAGLYKDSIIVKIVEKLVKTVNGDLNINFLGNLDPQQLISYLLQSHVYVHPSHIENSTNSICEAMLISMPVISTNTGGTSSLIEDNKEGILIQDGDPYILAGAILELSNNYDHGILMGKNARKTALKRHDPPKVVNNLISVYKTVIAEHKLSK